jgi:hypothetical protein
MRWYDVKIQGRYNSRYSLWRAIHDEPAPPDPTEYVR